MISVNRFLGQSGAAPTCRTQQRRAVMLICTALMMGQFAPAARADGEPSSEPKKADSAPGATSTETQKSGSESAPSSPKSETDSAQSTSKAGNDTATPTSKAGNDMPPSTSKPGNDTATPPPKSDNVSSAESVWVKNNPGRDKTMQDPDLRLHFELGSARVSKRNYSAALPELEAVLARVPDDKEALYLCGVAYIYTAQYDKARTRLTAAIEIDPSLQAAYVCRGEAFLFLNEFDKGKADCTKALELNETNRDASVAYNNRGVMEAKEKNYSAAIADFEASLKINPKYVQALMGRSYCESDQGKFDKALVFLDRAVAADPSFPAAYKSRAWVKTKVAERKGAIDDYTKYLQFVPDSFDALEKRGQLRQAEGDYNGSEADFAAALKAKDAKKNSTTAAAGASLNDTTLFDPGRLGLNKNTSAHSDAASAQGKASVQSNSSTPGTITSENISQLSASDASIARDYLNRVAIFVKSFWRVPAQQTAANGAVAFNIEKSGELSNAHLTDSSGDNAYDSAILAAVQEAKSYAPPPEFFKTPLQIRVNFKKTLRQPNLQQSGRLTPEQARSLNAYLAKLTSYVVSCWTAPVLSDAKQATVEFVLNSDGTFGPADLQKPSGDKDFDDSAMAAVKKAGKFPPPTFLKAKIKVHILFDNYRHLRQQPSI